MKLTTLTLLFLSLAHAAIVPVDITWVPGAYEVTYLGIGGRWFVMERSER